MADNDRVMIKNCYAEPWKIPYSDLRLATKPSESIGMASSYTYIAAPWDVGGGGMLGVINISDCGRSPPITKIKGHTSSIQDLCFSPFYDSILATASEDTTIRIWDIPTDPPEGHELKDPVAILTGSTKKVVVSSWNPTADFILASGCFDGNVSLWNVEMAALASQTKFAEPLLSIDWSYIGDRIAATTKDKMLNIIDPRTSTTVASVTAHIGAKAAKCCWVDGFAGTADHVLTTGFSKNNERELLLWDTRNIVSPVSRCEIDRGSQPLYPIFDEATGMLYVCGKGDGMARYYQLNGTEFRRIGDYRSTVPFKSFCFLPKMVVNQMRAEIARMFKNENGKTILPISFIVPRKNADVFQADLYPSVRDTEPALMASMWLEGKNESMRRVSIKPGDLINPQVYKPGGGHAPPKKMKSMFVTTNTPAVLQKEVAKVELENKKLADELKKKEDRLKNFEQLEALVSQQKKKIKDLENGLKGDLDKDGAEGCNDEVELLGANEKIHVLEEDIKNKENEIENLKCKLLEANQQISNLNQSKERLGNHMVLADSTLSRVSSIAGIDDNLRKEFNEVGNGEPSHEITGDDGDKTAKRFSIKSFVKRTIPLR